MKKTLLDLVQTVLSSLDSDEINSINDTVESQQVAKLVETAFYDIASRGALPEHKDLFELTASGDITKPTVMSLPDKVRHMEWLKYNKTDAANSVTANFSLITFAPLRDFLNITHSFSLSESNVGTFSLVREGDSIEFLYKNDKHPDYYTTFDDRTIVFDSYNSNEDSTLQKSKTLGYGELGVSFQMQDTFVPDLDEQQFALLLNQVKVLAFAELKQTPHPVAGGNSRKQWINMQKTKYSIPPSALDRLPNYGRRV